MSQLLQETLVEIERHVGGSGSTPTGCRPAG